MTGGIETVTTFVQDLPKTLTGRDEGNFDQEKLRKAYDRAVAYAGNRQIYRMNIYKDYVKLTIANPARENAYDDITMRPSAARALSDGTLHHGQARDSRTHALRSKVHCPALPAPLLRSGTN